MVDEIDIESRAHPFWGPVGLGMALNLPLLFAFRGWQTCRLLNGLGSPADLDFDRWQAAGAPVVQRW